MSDTLPHDDATGTGTSDSRQRLIEAAASVYATAGFRGATTRRIAEEAGVNEVTLFRLFGSKAALIEAAMLHHSAVPLSDDRPLPATPRDPLAELTAWSQHRLATLRERRSLIRQQMGEIAERPEVTPCAGRTLEPMAVELRRYMAELHRAGFVDGATRRTAGRNEEAQAAGAMLMAALFGDAMGRDMMPDMYPQPADRAAELYVTLFLRAIRCRV